MRKSMIVVALVFTLGLLGALDQASAQVREVIIEPGEVNAIMNAIMADLAATDSATVANTKYVLRRGATYVHDAQYEPTHPIWLEAEPGDGPRPRILAVHPASGEADRLILARNNLKFVGVDIDGFDSAGEHTDNAPVRVKGSHLRAYVEDCIFDNHRLEVARMDGEHQTLIFRNNIVRNNFQKDLWNKGWGIDLKNLVQDTLIIEQNTWFNTTTKIISHRNTAGIKYLRVSENTFVNVGGLYQPGHYTSGYELGVVDFGPAQTAICVNNLLINCGFMGAPDMWADSVFIFQLTITDSTEKIIFRNNNVYLDPDLIAALPDTAKPLKLFNPDLEAILGDGSEYGFISEPVTFVNAPSTDVLTSVIEKYYADPATAVLEVLRLDDSISNYDIDFRYNSDAASATGNTNGQPLGAWRWWPEINFQPVDYEALTAVQDNPVRLPDDFELLGNYPNPFNSSTVVRFNLPEPSEVSIVVYDLLGRRVWDVPARKLDAGMGHEIRIDADGWASGIYVYEITARTASGQYSDMGRMTLVK